MGFLDPKPPTRAELSATYVSVKESKRVVNLGALPDAVGNGLYDNTAIFQAALDRVGADSPAIEFHVPPGVWLTDGLKGKSNTVVQGVGGGTFGLNSFNSTRTSVLKLKPNATRPLISDYAPDNLSYGMVIRDIHLDGNKANQTTALSAIELQPSASGQDPMWRLERVFIDNAKGDGVKIGAFRRAVKILGGEILDVDGHAINLGATDCSIEGMNIGRSGGDGVNITAGLQHIQGNNIWGNTNGVTIAESAANVMLTNNGIDINRRHGISTNAPRTIMMANIFQTNGVEANNTYSHIDLGFPGTTALGCVVVGNGMRHDPAQPNKAKYGIQTNVAVNHLATGYDPNNVPWASGLTGNPALLVMAMRDQGFGDGVGIHMGLGGTGTGVRLGTAATQKMAFWGATPIVRPTMTNAAATDLATTTALVNELRSKLVSLGLVQ